MNHSKGFTLIEVIVVVAIIAALAAVAIPGYINWLPNYRLNAAARDLHSAAMKAKGEAVKRRTNCALTFNQSVGGVVNEYIVYVDANANCMFDPDEVIIDRLRQWPKQVYLSGVNFKVNGDINRTIAFRPNAIPTAYKADIGKCGGFANGTASLMNTNGKKKDVIINQAGNIRIE